MREKIIVGYLRGKLACREALENFLKGEKGASDMVAIMLVIVIVVALAAVFRENLTEAADTVFGKLLDEINK